MRDHTQDCIRFRHKVILVYSGSLDKPLGSPLLRMSLVTNL